MGLAMNPLTIPLPVARYTLFPPTRNGSAPLKHVGFIMVCAQGVRQIAYLSTSCWYTHKPPIKNMTKQSEHSSAASESPASFQASDHSPLLSHQESQTEAARLHAIFMQAPVAIAMFTGPTHMVELANPLVCQIWGRQPEQVLNKPLFEALPEARGQGFEELLDGVLRTGVPFVGKELPVTLIRAGKADTVYFNFVYQPVHGPQGTITGTMVVATDVGEQVQARQEIEEGAKRFQNLLEAMPQMTWTNLPEGSVNFYNERWYSYTGLTYAHLKDWGWQSVVHPDDLPETAQKYRHALATGEIFEVENRFRRGSDGTYRWHLTRALPIRNNAGEITLWVGTATDIHDQKRGEEQLKRTNQALQRTNADLDTFVYTASHDLRTPIATMEGLVQLLKRKISARLTEAESEYLSLMETSVTKLKRVIGDLTEITRIQKEFDELAEQVSFAEETDEVLSDIQEMVAGSQVVITTDFEVASINYTRKHLRSILYNLLSNAIKYRSPERIPAVHVCTAHRDSYVVLSIADNGLGIPEALQSKLFGMFQRLHTHVEGTGVGLHIVKRMVENSGGHIKVTSEENRGTKFEVFLVLIKPVHE